MKVNFFRRNLFQRVTFAGDVDKVIFKKFEKTDAFGDFTVFVRVDKQIHFIGRQVVDVLCQSRKADIRNFEGNTGAARCISLTTGRKMLKKALSTIPKRKFFVRWAGSKISSCVRANRD